MRRPYRKIFSGVLIIALTISINTVPIMAAEDVEIQKLEEIEIFPESDNDNAIDIDAELEDSEIAEVNSDEDALDESDVETSDIMETISAEEEVYSDPEEDLETNNEIVTYDVVSNTDTSGYNGFYQEPDGSDWYYYTDGQVASDKNDVIEGTVNEKNGWWYVVGGKVQLDYTGVANYANANGWWYIKDGKVDFSANTVAQNDYGWWYVVGGKVQFSYTGLANYGNAYGWWYIKNGKVDFSVNTVAQNNYGWWYVLGGKVQFNYNGVANYANANGWWYIKDGKVDFSANTVAQNNNGWWYVLGGKVQFNFTGLANYANSYGWWYIKNGKVDFSANTVVQNDYGWWYVSGGKVQFSYNGFAQNDNGWWYIENGKVSFSTNSVIEGTVNGNNGWWYTVGGKVQTTFTGLANYANSYGWWYIKNGKVDFSANTVAQNDFGWWYVEGGKVIFSFNGIAKNSNGWWYIKDGKVDFSYNGKVTVSAGTYSVVNGQVQNVNVSDSVSSEIKDVEDSGESEGKYDYTVPEEYITYSGTDTNQLSAPRFTGTVNSNGTMTLTWEPVSGAEKYLVLRKKYGDSNWTELATTTATTYTDNKYPGETDVYFYSVCCVNAAGTKHTSPYISSFSGSAVAEYGQLFEGRPYVWGGTSLINGCDCSGFVMQVYAHFGVLMYHYSGAQRQIGKEVSYENAQPGDIMGYDGHTGIYIGNGKMVHASNAIDGIKISEVNTSRSGFGVRRIF